MDVVRRKKLHKIQEEQNELFAFKLNLSLYLIKKYLLH